MPITQDRILALVSAAEAYADAFASLRDAANALLRSVPVPSDEFVQLYSAMMLCEPPASAQVTIATERQHYMLTHLRNEKHKLRQRKRRAQAPQPYLVTKEALSDIDLSDIRPGPIESKREAHSDPDDFNPLDFEEESEGSAERK